MADTGSIPFGNVVDYVRNQGDDDFESSFDETYGDPNYSNPLNDGSTSEAFMLIFMAASFLFCLFLFRYFCFWFIDYCIMCDHRRNRRNNNSNNPGSSSNGDGDDPTAANTIDHSNRSDNSDDSDEPGTELVERNRSYARRLMLILSEDEKRTIFSSILESRFARITDIQPKYGDSSSDDSESDNDSSSAKESSIDVPDGGPLPNQTDGNESNNNNNNNHACCPICIQDIKVLDRVYHCNHCQHLFHYDCMLAWVGTGSMICPYCRREIFTRERLEQAYENFKSRQKQVVCP